MTRGLLQIRDVPEGTRRVLKARAAARGQSLNAYLLDLIDREVAQPTIADVLQRAAARSEKVDVNVAELVRSDRAGPGGRAATQLTPSPQVAPPRPPGRARGR